MGFGGIIAQGIAGAIGGGAQAAADDITMRQKEEMENRRQQQLSRLRMDEHAANAQVSSDINAKAAIAARGEQLKFETDNSGQLNANAAAKITATTGATKDAESAAAARNSAQDNDTEMNKVLAHAAAVNAAKTPEEKAMEKAKLDAEIAKVGLTKAQAAQAYAVAGLDNAKRDNEILNDGKKPGDTKIVEDKWRTAGKTNADENMEESSIVPGVTRWTDKGTTGKPGKPAGIVNRASMGMIGDNAKPAVEAVAPGTHYSYKGKEISAEEYESMRDEKIKSSTQTAREAKKPQPSYDPKNYDSEVADAQRAISKGKDPYAVRAEFKRTTGRDLPSI